MDIPASNSPIVLRGRLKGPQLARVQGLLNMAYTPVELAKGIGFTRRQVYRVYMHLGCPFERDETGHLWKMDDRKHGVFATRHPFRPNHIGISIVHLLSRER